MSETTAIAFFGFPVPKEQGQEDLYDRIAKANLKSTVRTVAYGPYDRYSEALAVTDPAGCEWVYLDNHDPLGALPTCSPETQQVWVQQLLDAAIQLGIPADAVKPGWYFTATVS